MEAPSHNLALRLPGTQEYAHSAPYATAYNINENGSTMMGASSTAAESQAMFATANQMVLAVKTQMEKAAAAASERAAQAEEKEAALLRERRQLQSRASEYERRICDLAASLDDAEHEKMELQTKLQVHYHDIESME